MIKKSTQIQMDHAMACLMPPVDPSIEVESFADADEIQRGIIKLQKMRETAEIQYKEIRKRNTKSRDDTLDTFDAQLQAMKHRLETWLRPKIEDGTGHYDLPSGRMQISKNPAAIVIGCDSDELQTHLKKLYKSKEEKWKELQKACVRVTLIPVKPALAKLHQALLEDKGEETKPSYEWFDSVQGETVSFNGDKSDPIPSPVEGRVPDALDRAIAKREREKHNKETLDKIQEEIIEENPNADVPFLPADNKHLDSPTGTTADKPQIFEAPRTEHFDDEGTLTRALAAFKAMTVTDLLAGQDRITPDQIKTFPIERIKGGLKKMFDTIGFSALDKKAWVSYHMGKHPLDLNPAELPESAYRKLLALAIHATTMFQAHYPHGIPAEG